MNSDNPSGADNQQERPGIEQWIVGFVDGEGCFSCPIQRNTTMTLGWQCQPRFAVVQAERSVRALELLRSFFECGKIYRNRRHDNHREDLLVFNVWSRRDLVEKIVPFFEANSLLTAKQEEFLKFRTILLMMGRGMHLNCDGLRRIAEIQQTMNHRKPSQFLESSEAIRQPSLLDRGDEEMVLTPWRHGDARTSDLEETGSERNSLSGKFRPARMA
jgi:LAGLIDADG endonuclease